MSENILREKKSIQQRLSKSLSLSIYIYIYTVRLCEYVIM